jgi:hypothetical protein
VVGGLDFEKGSDISIELGFAVDLKVWATMDTSKVRHLDSPG